MHRVARLIPAALTIMLILVAASAQAAGDAERGAVLANTCLGCHGIPGYRNAYPNYRVPMLGGQHEDYLVISLQGYQADMRDHPTMKRSRDR